MEGYAGVFGALKNGVLMEELEGFENEQLRPFLPVLMLSAFPNDASAEDNLVSTKAHMHKKHAYSLNCSDKNTKSDMSHLLVSQRHTSSSPRI